MQMPGKTIKKIAILQTMGAIKFTDPNLDTALPRALRSSIRLQISMHSHAFPFSGLRIFRIVKFTGSVPAGCAGLFPSKRRIEHSQAILL